VAEGSIGLPPDGAGGKKLRTLTGGAAQPVDTHQEVDSLAHPDGTLVVVGAGLPVALDVNGQLTALLTELGQKLEPGQAVALDAATLAALENITAAVTGTVAVSNLPATQPVSATALPLPAGAATQTTLAGVLAALTNVPVTGPVTDTQLRAAALAVTAAALPLPAGAATEATVVPVRNRFDAVLTAKATYTTSGPHTLITPAAGQAVRVLWLYAQAKAALDTGTVLVTFTLGTHSYDFELTGSQPFAHTAVWDGAAGETLVVTTSSTAAVLVNVDHRAFTP